MTTEQQWLTVSNSPEPPAGYARPAGRARPVDYDLVGQIRRDVNRELSQWTATLESLPSTMEQRRRAEELITTWLERRMLSSVESGVPVMSVDDERAVRAATLAAMFGLGRLEALLAEEGVEDIYIAGTRPVIVKMSDGRRELRDPIAATEADLMQQVESIATHHGQNARSVTSARPWLNLRLPGHARLAAMWGITPVPYVTIRRHNFVDITLDKLVAMNTLSPAMAAFLQAAVLGKRSILVVGAQSSGKTTLVRALCRCIPPTERYATLESEYELLLHELPDAPPNLLAAEEREGLGERGPDGRPAGEVLIGDFFPATLRHSLDRCVVGEVRGSEVTALLKAMTRGYKGSIATFHADSAAETVLALSALISEHQTNWSYDAAVHQIAAAVDLVVYIDREPTADGVDYRFVSHILEINGVGEAGTVSVTPIFEPPGEVDSPDPRGYLVGQPADPRWWRRAGLDPRWLEPAQSGWPQPFPTPAWRVG